MYKVLFKVVLFASHALAADGHKGHLLVTTFFLRGGFAAKLNKPHDVIN